MAHWRRFHSIEEVQIRERPLFFSFIFFLTKIPFRIYFLSVYPVDIIGSAQTTGFSALFEQGQQISLPATALAANQAFKMAALSLNEIDIVEIHDCFTPAEIVDSEDLGFFEKGKGGWAVQDGLTRSMGNCPLTPVEAFCAKGILWA